MKRIPEDLDLSALVGEITTQIRVGKYDIQFSIGKVNFSIWSPIKILRDGKEIGNWEEDKWPDSAFIEVLNVKVTKYETPNQEFIALYFENGVGMYFGKNDEQLETMSIYIEGESALWFM